ncbi:MAG: thioredoxin family protein [Phycisphaerales bacterium]|nr:thioredoxin family protein [Phycisphaerales bacterium]
MRRSFAVVAGMVGVAGMLAGAPVVSGEPPAAPSKAAGQPGGEKARVYDEAADAKQQIAAAIARAKKENRRVLVQWGGNWCPWCIALHGLFKSDKAIARTLMYEYEVVYVDAGKPAGKNVDLAKTYGADLAANGYPFLTILDGNGKPIANQETAALEVKDESGKSKGVAAGHDPKLVLKFLEEHKASYQSAEAMVPAAIAQARAEGKVVFLHFGAPWCGWCHKLEAWMARPDVAPVLAKAFVDLKIDTDRTVGGSEVLARYSKGQNGGIPWFVFLDGDGKSVIDSTGPKGNIGFPAAPEEIEHFGVMLRKTGKLSEAEVTGLLDSLKAASAK